jgi:multicomponent Na+:H+ antiporter subunit D
MTGIEVLPPALPLLAGALVILVMPRRARPWVFLAATALALVFTWTAPDGTHGLLRLAGLDLILFRVDALSRLFGLVFAFIALAGGVYAFHIRESVQPAAALFYVGGSLGVIFAGDFYTLLVFWEIMAVSSAVLVWAAQTPESTKAGWRYLMVHLFGGVLLFAGILMHAAGTGDTVVAAFAPGGASAAAWLILCGVAINAAVPPLHAWLPDAYPRSTVTGSVFLSAFTTKVAVYALLRLFPGWEILLGLGVLMAIYGVVYALLANDIRSILSYHIISQVGYMLAGAGIGTALAVNAAAAHAYNNILYKTLLFMGAGAVIQATGKNKLTELGGLARAMPWTVGLYIIGGLSISGAPLFNGFISKSMVVAAVGEAHHDWAVLLLLLASVGTFLSVGLKLPYFAWFGGEKTPAATPSPVPWHMTLAMAATAALCIAHGIVPPLLYRFLPHPAAFEAYTAAHIIEVLEILVFSFAAFWLLRNFLHPKAGVLLDTDWFYRRPGAAAARLTVSLNGRFFDATDRAAEWIVGRAVRFIRNPAAALGKLATQVRAVASARPVEAAEHSIAPGVRPASTRLLLLLILAVFIVLAFLALLAI